MNSPEPTASAIPTLSYHPRPTGFNVDTDLATMNLRAILSRQTCATGSVVRHFSLSRMSPVVVRAKETANDVNVVGTKSGLTFCLKPSIRPLATSATRKMSRPAGTENFQFNHTMIRVKDPQKSLEFYRVSTINYPSYTKVSTIVECPGNVPYR